MKQSKSTVLCGCAVLLVLLAASACKDTSGTGKTETEALTNEEQQTDAVTEAETEPLPAENRRAVYAKLLKLAEAECENAEKTIPLVENDSRFGYTPELGCCTSAEQLRWKIHVTRRAVRELREEAAHE